MQRQNKFCLQKYAVCALLCVVLLAGQASAFDASRTDYTINSDGKQAYIPVCYETEAVLDEFGEYGLLKEPEHIFYSPDGNLYIADSGNNRILKCTVSGEVLWEYTGENETGLYYPRGLFVSEDGVIYVSDTGNCRIVCLSEEDGFIKSYTKPDSPLLSEYLTFDVSKAVVTQTGTIYALKDKQLISMDENNEFKGFVGVNKLPFNLTNLLIRIFATSEQKLKITKPEPEPYASFTLGNDGMIYAVAMSASNQIKKINAIGSNLYPDGFYGENVISASGQVLTPAFSDISVSETGIVTVTERNASRIYQYEAEGRLLCVFGGKGTKEGKFIDPVAIDEDADGRLFVLDKGANNIQIMKRTPFIESVHTALEHYYKGDYKTAAEYWTQTLEFNLNYELAHESMGKTQYKSKDYEAAMESNRKANSKKNYSDAFSQFRHRVFRGNFTLVVLIVVVLLTAIVSLIVFLKKTAKRMTSEMVHGKGGKMNG